jgi:hypothetical protein
MLISVVNAHVMTVGRGDQEQLTKHLKTSRTNEWMKKLWVTVWFIVVKRYPLCCRVQRSSFCTVYILLNFRKRRLHVSAFGIFFTGSVAMNGTTSATVVQWLTCSKTTSPLHLQYHRLCDIGENTNAVFPINIFCTYIRFNWLWRHILL